MRFFTILTRRPAALQVVAGAGAAIALVAGPAPGQDRHDSRDDRAAVVSPDQGHPEYVAGELLVKIAAAAPAADVRNARRTLGSRVVKSFPAIGWELWRLDGDRSVPRAIQELTAPRFHGSIEHAEPNYLLHAADCPGDPGLSELWGLLNVGQTGGTIDADIDATEAWIVEVGSPAVVVAVIDTGIDYDHVDLAANMWVNPSGGEDLHGYDFVNGDPDPMDDNGHGTHVAGTIGAVGGDGVGVTGVNWYVSLMALKFLDSSGSGSTANAIDAVNYAAAHGARIINASWGGGHRSRSLEDAIAASGALFVAAAGNNGNSRKHFPAAYGLDDIIAVAATDHDDELASFSSFGDTWVDLAAPGVNTYSTVRNDGYGYKSGTSMAAPHVAGVAALMIAQAPASENAAVKSLLLGTVDLLPSLAGVTVTGGRLNAASALGAPSDDTTAPADPTGLMVSSASHDSVTVSWLAPGDDGMDGTACLYDVRCATTPISGEAEFAAADRADGEPAPSEPGLLETFTLDGLIPDTQYFIAVRAFDDAGNPSGLATVEATTAAPPPGSWSAEIVQVAPDISSYTSLALTSGGVPAIAYVSDGGLEVRLAEWDGAAWSVGNAADSDGYRIDLAFDPSDAPAIVFSRGRKMLYTTRDGGGWTVESADRSTAFDDVVSLDFGPDGQPAIAYGKTGFSLAFARRLGPGDWTKETIDPDGGRYQAFAFGPDGLPAIAYACWCNCDCSWDTLSFASFDGAAWSTEQVLVQTTVSVGIAFDPLSGALALVHDPDQQVQVVRRDGSEWQPEVIGAGRRPSIAFGPSGTLFVAYRVSGTPTVSFSDGAGWSTEVVEPTTASSIALAVDPDGNPVVAYTVNDGGSVRLMLARKQMLP